MESITGINIASYSIKTIKDAHIPGHTTFTLMTPAVQSTVSKNVDDEMIEQQTNDINNNKGYKWDEPNYEHKQRLSYASASSCSWRNAS